MFFSKFYFNKKIKIPRVAFFIRTTMELFPSRQLNVMVFTGNFMVKIQLLLFFGFDIEATLNQ